MCRHRENAHSTVCIHNSRKTKNEVQLYLVTQREGEREGEKEIYIQMQRAKELNFVAVNAVMRSTNRQYHD